MKNAKGIFTLLCQLAVLGQYLLMTTNTHRCPQIRIILAFILKSQIDLLKIFFSLNCICFISRFPSQLETVGIYLQLRLGCGHSSATWWFGKIQKTKHNRNPTHDAFLNVCADGEFTEHLKSVFKSSNFGYISFPSIFNSWMIGHIQMKSCGLN